MLIWHTILYLPAQLLGPAFQFLAAVVWTHWLAADSYGALAYVMASQELASVICLGWWSNYALRYVGTFNDEKDRRRFQASENFVLCCSAVLQIVVCLVMLRTLEIEVSRAFVASSLFYCVSRSLATHLGERARAAGRIGTYTVAQMIGPIVGFGLAFALVSRYEASPAAALAGFAVAQILGNVWLWRDMRLPIAFAMPDRAILRRALIFGVPLIVAGSVAWISVNGIRVIVGYAMGAAAVGLISVGWGLGQRLASVVSMLVAAAAFPLAVKHLQAGARETALRQLSVGGAILAGLLAPSGVGILFLSGSITHLMIGAPFQAITLAVLPMAALAGAIRNLRVHFSDQATLLFERTDLNIVINLVEAVLTMLFCLVGIKLGGLPGAAAGCLAGSVCGTVFGFAFGISRFGLIVPWADFMRILVATAAMAVVLVLLPFQAIPLNLASRMAIEIMCGGVVYLVTLAALYPALVGNAMRRLRAPRSVAL